MAGFLGLGGSSESYFLEPDDSKTMGDIDYMRTSKKVKRTFPNTKGWGDVGASEKTVSAYDERGGDPSASTAATPSYAPSTPSYTPPTLSYAAPVAPATPVAEPSPEPTPAPAEAATEATEPAPAPEVEPAPAPEQEAPATDSMDMFRAMARKMR